MTDIALMLTIGACLWIAYDVMKLEKRLSKAQQEIEHLRNVATVLNARTMVCRSKLELVESELDQLLVEKYSPENSEVIQ